MKALSCISYGMDALMGGVDAMAGEDYAGGAGIVWIDERFQGEEEDD
jgi:hypothetical protein